jgi:hypothetical protein
VYSSYIIQKSSTSNYSANNQRDLVLDTAENLTQVATWTLTRFVPEKDRIELYLRLIRKDINALASFPLSTAFNPGFSDFCTRYEKMEQEYKSGLVDRTGWANRMIKWADTLTKSINLI